ncbi:hypothetical protein OA84_06895 [Kaistella solincola]|uniref:Lipoprotein n=2 Tax=Kaistella solincola TaxID=510955 RepID=A0ABR4ZPI7_9FLAO|nr:hypothetical protein OA84_06895 [Kaistella solincola]
MKILFINFFLLFLTSCATAQKTEDMQIVKEFPFSGENLFREIEKKAAKVEQIKDIKITLPTPAGDEEFKLMEYNLGEKRVPGFYTFRGASADGQKILTLTVKPKSMSGMIRYNAENFYIEKVKNAKNKYQLYLPKPVKNQENDALK